MANTRKFRVGVTRGRWRYFATLEDAKAFCARVFDAANVILCIEAC